MNDIEIVIKMPMPIYKAFMEDYTNTTDVLQAVRKCILLPKGHGRLIDADEIQFENNEFDTYSDYSRAFDAIDQAETIIEADRSEE